MDKRVGMRDGLIHVYPDFLAQKLDELWLTKRLEAALPVLRCFDARKVLLTGNSEGLAAVTSVVELFQSSDIFSGAKLVSQGKYNCGDCKHELGIGEPNTPLVIIVDLDGNDEDIGDSIKMTLEIGGVPLLITVNEDAEYASLTDYVLSLGTVRNMAEAYSAAVVALVALACRIRRVRGQYTEADCRRVRQAILDYAALVAASYEELDKGARRFAKEIYGKKMLACIGDGSSEAVMEFSAFFMTRHAGFLCAQYDSEEWGRAKGWERKRAAIPAVAIAAKASSSYGCFVENTKGLRDLGQPYLLITDGDEEDFGEGVDLLKMPRLPKDCDFLCALFFHLPIVTAYEYVRELRRGGG